MRKKLILITATIFSFFYCLRFGYIWTAYGHGGQLAGIPFAALMLILTVLYFSNESLSGKFKFFAFSLIYFLSLAGFTLTIEIIRSTRENYFTLLYHEPGGYVNKILLGWLVLGAIAFIIVLMSLRLSSHYHRR
jgi:hypothetical protein